MDNQFVYFLEEKFLLIFAENLTKNEKKDYQDNLVRNVIKNL